MIHKASIWFLTKWPNLMWNFHNMMPKTILFWFSIRQHHRVTLDLWRYHRNRKDSNWLWFESQWRCWIRCDAKQYDSPRLLSQASPPPPLLPCSEDLSSKLFFVPKSIPSVVCNFDKSAFLASSSGSVKHLGPTEIWRGFNTGKKKKEKKNPLS